MKMNRLIAALVVAFSLCVVSTKGVIDPYGLPTSLEAVGSLEKFRSWIVTNQMVRVDYAIYFVNLQGQNDFQYNSEGVTFKSHSGFQQFMASNCFRFFNLRRTNMNPTTQVEAVYHASYYLPELNPNRLTDALTVDTAVGIPSAVNSNSFVNLPTQKEYAYIRVPGLQKFVVEVTGLYTNSWPAESGRPIQIPPPGFNPPQFPTELTTNNYVILNRWYSMGTNDVTFTITVGPNTRRYNRFGEALNKPPTVTANSGTITASFSRWATVSIESSPDLHTWTTVTNFVDSSGLGTVSLPMPIKKTCLMEFFRAGAH